MRINWFSIFICLLFIVPSLAFAQNTFEERLNFIQEILEKKAQEEIPGLLEKTEFSLVDATIHDLLRGLAETHQLNISVSPAIQVNVTNNFTNVTVKDLILFLCREYHLNVEFVNNIMSFTNFEDPPIEKKPSLNRVPEIKYNFEDSTLSVDLKNDSLSVVVREISRQSRRNVIVAHGVEDRLMKVYASEAPFTDGIELIAFSNGLRVEVDTIRQVYKLLNKEEDKAQQSVTQQTSRSSGSPSSVSANENLSVSRIGSRRLSVEANNVPIIDVIKEAAVTSLNNYVLFSQPQGNSYIKVNNISFDDLLDVLLRGTDHTYDKEEEIFIIGNRIEEGFRRTKLVKFQYRTAFEIENSIPETLKKDVQILPFKELNALILSGGESHLKEIETFLKQIDQPVPNIMIEVVVIDVRKSSSIETGISAFLTDSTVKSGGKVAPGLDFVLGSDAVNNVLDKFETVSSINLGRVNSKFYMKLKALEQSGNIKIRSTPKLSTLNGHEAVLTIGESMYYEEKTQNVTGGVNPIITQTPRYSKVDANMTITIKPMVSGDENITLNIEAEFSNFVEPRVPNAPPGNATRKFLSQIRVLNQEMVLLGGLDEVSKEESGSGFPVLSKIPILKWIFSSRNKSSSDNELIVLIKPQIVY
ncbi:type II secretion system protein GspD [Marinilabilia sp.]|uniref:type II secretion system protein GspD n=1 Tax=Marinilabilia sp. TaxID=2021252 RepID=UPI0025BD7035|nr:type II and III secretion system protein [Marinilabilia sp.]